MNKLKIDNLLMELISLIVTSVSTLLSLCFGGGAIYLWRETKQLKATEVSDKQAEVEAKRLDNELKQAEWEHERYLETKKEVDEYKLKISDLYVGIGKIKDLYREKCDECQELKFLCEKKDWFRCDVNDCMNRIPPRNYATLLEEQEEICKHAHQCLLRTLNEENLTLSD